MSALEMLGIGSAALVLFAFMANEYGKLTSESIAYDFLNLLGSIGLFAYAWSTGVVPFMITNAVWGLISGIDVVKYFLTDKKKQPVRRRRRV